MGGPGSGRVAGFGGPTCEELHSIDIRELARKGGLKSGSKITVSWTWNEETVATAYMTVNDGHAILDYYERNSEGTKRHDQEKVELASTTGHYGGNRPWFICPECGRRCAILYALGRFLCRKCHHLTYQCQKDDELQRLARRIDEIRGKLDGFMVVGEFFPERPYKMHHKRYQRMVEKHDGLQSCLWERAMEKFPDHRT